MKRYLLDTCVFLWAVREPSRLSRQARRVLESNVPLLLSPVTAWEIISKSAALELNFGAADWVCRNRQDLGLEWLPLHGEHSVILGSLPPIHNDPYDRMLICQAMAEGLVLITPNDDIQKYPVPTLW